MKELIRKVTFQKSLNFKDLAANRKNIIKLTTSYTKEGRSETLGKDSMASEINKCNTMAIAGAVEKRHQR